MTRRRTLVLLGLAVVVVQIFLVAGVWIPAPHNGGDNAGYVALAHSLLEGEGYVEAWDPARPPHTKYPPVFPAMLAVAIALGARTWTALKLVPAAATTAAVLLAFLWAARRRTPVFGASVAILLAAGSGVLWYSHWVLSDIPFTAFTLLTFVALERAVPPGEPRRPRQASGGGGGSVAPPEDRRVTVWMGVGFAAAVLAYFTRSAGLPLLVAVAGWLALRRRWRNLGAFVVVAGVPGFLWWLRGRATGGEYTSEFWMVDPYIPELGTIGPGDLASRIADNAALYAMRHIPEGLLGVGGGGLALIGLGVLVLAAVGWGMRFASPSESVPAVRVGGAPGPLFGGVHVAEIFLPLYAALLLLWPQVWSGDRFALPLFPLLLFYAGDALLRLVRRVSPKAVGAAGVVAVLVVAIPAGWAWTQAREEARGCAELTRSVGMGPFACHGPAWTDFVDAARWAGSNLPPESSVLTRKPRIFYVMGGVASRTYPFTADPRAFREAATDAESRYVLLDALGPQSAAYVGRVVQQRPEWFCSVATFGGRSGGGGTTRLLGVVGDGEEGGAASAGGAVTLPRCPPSLEPEEEVPLPRLHGMEIPLLVR